MMNDLTVLLLRKIAWVKALTWSVLEYCNCMANRNKHFVFLVLCLLLSVMYLSVISCCERTPNEAFVIITLGGSMGK